ncbi:MAG TPA: O-methyltransferase [Balneolaceae bacterium]|nr:O-methyltransferase [Balneolaceae bacterium]
MINPDKELVQYCNRHTTEESEILKELVKKTESELQYSDMICGPQVGELLKLLIRVSGSKRVLEIGTFTGYSALMMADALPVGGELITLELNECYKSISEQFFSRDPYCKIIKQVMGDAVETIDSMKGKFDLIFIDADKALYPEYYQKSKPKLKAGGIIIVDNVLWSGEILHPDDPKSAAIDRLNEMIRSDPDMQNVMLPVRDGVLIARYQPGSKARPAHESTGRFV